MYEIKVLDSNEFDSVAKSDPRYSYVDDTNMGFSDRMNGTAYIRNTYIHDLNKYLVNHELEELEADESTHEDENGIRHKKFFKDIVAPFSTNPAGIFGGEKGPLTPLAPGQPQIAFPDDSQGQQTAFAPQGQVASAPQTAFPQQVAPSSPTNSFVGQGGTGALGQSPIGNPLSGIGSIDIDPELAQRVKGFFSGRLAF